MEDDKLDNNENVKNTNEQTHQPNRRKGERRNSLVNGEPLPSTERFTSGIPDDSNRRSGDRRGKSEDSEKRNVIFKSGLRPDFERREGRKTEDDEAYAAARRLAEKAKKD